MGAALEMKALVDKSGPQTKSFETFKQGRQGVSTKFINVDKEFSTNKRNVCYKSIRNHD